MRVNSEKAKDLFIYLTGIWQSRLRYFKKLSNIGTQETEKPNTKGTKSNL